MIFGLSGRPSQCGWTRSIEAGYVEINGKRFNWSHSAIWKRTEDSSKYCFLDISIRSRQPQCPSRVLLGSPTVPYVTARDSPEECLGRVTRTRGVRPGSNELARLTACWVCFVFPTREVAPQFSAHGVSYCLARSAFGSHTCRAESIALGNHRDRLRKCQNHRY